MMIVLGEFHIRKSPSFPAMRAIAPNHPMLKNYTSFISSFVNNLFISSHMFARTIIRTSLRTSFCRVAFCTCLSGLAATRLRCSLTNGCITYAVFIGYCSDDNEPAR
jgi:protein-S-isoprenylcysteine O-methyltransferase Ste14